MQDLVRRFGPRLVWAVGVKSLGYPPTWITWGSEVLRLAIAMEKQTALNS